MVLEGIDTNIYYILSIGLILFIGILISALSSKIKISDILFLILAGVGLGYLQLDGSKLIQFSPVFLTTLAIIALSMIVFDSTSRLKLKEIDSLSVQSIKLSLLLATLVMIFLPLFMIAVIPSYRSNLGILLAFLFASIMTGTSPAVVMSMMNNLNKKHIKILEIESIITTPLTVLIPTIILDLFSTFNGTNAISGLPFVLDITQAFVMKIIVGFGTGLLFGMIVFKSMRRVYSKTISPLVTIATAILTYAVAETLQGNGVLAVTTLGVLFGNVYVKNKPNLQEYSQTFSSILRILVFILIGITVTLPWDFHFWLNVLLLFAVYTIIRGTTISFIFRKSNLTPLEKLFMTLNGAKGIAVVVMTFSLYTYRTIIKIIGQPLWQYNINMIIAFTIISILVSTVATRFRKKLFEEDNSAMVDVSNTDNKLPHLDQGILAMRNYSKNLRKNTSNNETKDEPIRHYSLTDR